MADIVATDLSVTIDGNDVSDHVTNVSFTYLGEAQENTAMGDATRKRIGGLKDWNVTVEFNQDYAAGQVDALMFPLVGTTFTIIILPTSSAVGAGNPSFSGTSFMENYNPIQGSVGEVITTSISLLAAGTLTRSTS